MRTLETYIVDSREVTLSPDQRLQPAQLAQSLLEVRLRDETTSLPPETPLRASCSDARLTARIVEGGLAGISGFPNRAPGVPVRFSVEGERILPFNADVVLPANLGTVDLHRKPVTITGRTARRQPDGSIVLVSPATVDVVGIWRVRPAAGQAADSPMPNLLSLRPGAYTDRSAAANIRAISLTPAAGDLRTLRAFCAAGAKLIRVSDSNGIAPGDVIALDPSHDDRAEYLTIQSIAATADPDAEADIELAFACRNSHRAGTAAPRAITTLPGPDNNLSAAIVAGEECLVAATTGGLAGASFAEIHSGGPPASEYQQIFPLTAIFQGPGYFHFPPLSRAGQLTLRASDGTTTIDQTVTIDYQQPFQTVNFTWT